MRLTKTPNSDVPRICPSNPRSPSFPTKLVQFVNPRNPRTASHEQPLAARSGRFRTMDVGLRQATLVLLNKGNLKLKESSKAIVENLLHLGLARNGSGKYGDAPPLRSELFSAEQMKQHGRTLAGQHKLSTGRAPDQLLARLAENESVLVGGPRADHRGGGRRTPDHSRRRMAAGQLLSDRRADSHRQAAPAEALQPGTAAPAARSFRRTSPGLRHRAGDHFTRRRARGPGKSHQLCGRLPDGDAADSGRVVGAADHAAPGADREPAARVGAHRQRSHQPEPRRHLGGPTDRDRRRRIRRT